MKHFNYSEFAADGQRELPSRYHQAVERLVRVWLDPLREEFGRCTVHSGLRTAEQNRRVGGAPRSKHRYASQPTVAAADVTFATGTPQEWADAAHRLHERCGLGVYPDHLHIDSRRTIARWSDG